MNYKINLQEWTPGESQLLFENQHIEVHSFPLNHRINCSGFKFQEKPKKRRINKNLLSEELSPPKIIALKNGEDVLNEDGSIKFSSKEYTIPPAKSVSYAFCSDTKYDESIVPFIKNVDLLYHEATFLNDMKDRAELTFHSTAQQAGEMANKAKVKKLIVGHFSTRYKILAPVLEEAKIAFENTALATEGEEFNIS